MYNMFFIGIVQASCTIGIFVSGGMGKYEACALFAVGLAIGSKGK